MGFRLSDLGSILDLDSAAIVAASGPVVDAAPGQWLAVPRGATRRYRATLLDPSTGLPLAGAYSDGDTPSAVAWEGGAGPALAALPASWDDAGAATVIFAVRPPDLAALEPQPYPLRVSVTRADGSVDDLWDAWLEVLESPGSAAPVPVYCTYRDMLDHCGGRLAELLTPGERAGFLVERGRAREWLDALILAKDPRPRLSAWWDQPTDYGFAPSLASLGNFGFDLGPAPDLVAWLAAGALLTPPRVVEMVARKAAALVMERQTAAEWRAEAAYQHRKASALAASTVAQIDYDGDGKTDLGIHLGKTSLRDL